MSIYHILIIGSASYSNSGINQLPEPEELKNSVEILSKEGYNPYLYFIDPRHAQNDSDNKYFNCYWELKIPHCVIALSFDLKKFEKEYKVSKQENALFVDYSGITNSEYDFIINLGNNPKWLYYTAGCQGDKFDLIKSINYAKNLSRYTVYSNDKIPKGLSDKYKESLLNELNELIIFSRLLPDKKEDVDKIPEWLKKHHLLLNVHPETIIEIKLSSLQIIENFFNINNVSIYEIDSVNWYIKAKSLFNN